MDNLYAEITDKKGRIVHIRPYNHIFFEDDMIALFGEGFPDSFDEYDLQFIRKFLARWNLAQSDKGCFMAIVNDKLVGACLFAKKSGPQDQWEISYIYVKEELRGSGIGRMLIGILEECLKDKARVIFAINAGILPREVISYPFWRNAGYDLWGVLEGYFRDDLSGIFLVKRNPFYAIGQGISEDSGWDPTLADSMTGKKISKREYYGIIRSLPQASRNKWGFGLIDAKNVLVVKERE